jgi:hypothetical protein
MRDFAVLEVRQPEVDRVSEAYGRAVGRVFLVGLLASHEGLLLRQ